MQEREREREREREEKGERNDGDESRGCSSVGRHQQMGRGERWWPGPNCFFNFCRLGRRRSHLHTIDRRRKVPGARPAGDLDRIGSRSLQLQAAGCCCFLLQYIIFTTPPPPVSSSVLLNPHYIAHLIN